MINSFRYALPELIQSKTFWYACSCYALQSTRNLITEPFSKIIYLNIFYNSLNKYCIDAIANY